MYDMDTRRVLETLETLSPDIYELTRISAEEFYANGYSENMAYAMAESGLTQEEILWAW